MAGGHDAASVALVLGLEYDWDWNAVLLPGWVARDESGCEVAFPEVENAAEAAQAYVDSGDWPVSGQTSFHSVATWRVGLTSDWPTAWDEEQDEGEETVELEVDECVHTITVDLDEPDCMLEQGHRWIDWAGPYGSGGGVKYTELCPLCGLVRHTDTWGTNPTNGTQGHVVTQYESDSDELSEHLGRVDTGDLDYAWASDGEGWGLLVAGPESRTGLWAQVYQEADAASCDVTWYPSEEAALVAALADDKNMRR
jgi:hypothetical protein